MSDKPRVVIDTQLFLRAAINLRSLPAKLILEMVDRYDLIMSLPIADEIKDVLNRPTIRAKFPDLSDEVVNRIIVRLEDAEWVLLPDVPAVGRDPKDDIFLATAVNGEAHYIASEDKDLLVLNPYKGIQIVNALKFLEVLRGGEE